VHELGGDPDKGLTAALVSFLSKAALAATWGADSCHQKENMFKSANQ